MSNVQFSRLVATRALYYLVIMGAVVLLCYGLATFLGNGQLGLQMYAVFGFYTVLMIVEAFRFASRNVTHQQVIHFEPDAIIKERLDAIMIAMGYLLTDDRSNELTYKASAFAGAMNRPVSIQIGRSQVIITGPSFALDHIYNRIEHFHYAGVVLGARYENSNEFVTLRDLERGPVYQNKAAYSSTTESADGQGFGTPVTHEVYRPKGA